MAKSFHFSFFHCNVEEKKRESVFHKLLALILWRDGVCFSPPVGLRSQKQQTRQLAIYITHLLLFSSFSRTLFSLLQRRSFAVSHFRLKQSHTPREQLSTTVCWTPVPSLLSRYHRGAPELCLRHQGLTSVNRRTFANVVIFSPFLYSWVLHLNFSSKRLTLFFF